MWKKSVHWYCLVLVMILGVFCPSEIFSIRIELDPESGTKCDYSKCPATDPNKLNVHLIAHTHDDVGWLKTVDQYYYGSQNWIQNAGVQYILDTVVEELIRNEQRKFIYVETAFFWKWWQEQDDQQRSIVKELVRTGQLEFINGGWSMPDEATTHYNSLIDQSTWGLRRLNDIFGKCGRPTVTWQIDPFGHSRELASLYAQMGYDAVYFAREDYLEMDKRQKARTLEHVWHGSDDLGSIGDLFTGMMQMHYGPPKGFNWDLVGGVDEPVIDNPKSEEYNVPKIVGKFADLARNYSRYYATNHIMFPMGTDFNYASAHQWFKNMDKLIAAIHLHGKHGNADDINVFYSTPSCYTKALWNLNRTWTGKNDDYFPYASDPHAYWTGYFTSRPALKRMERVGNNWLQACKQLDSLAGNRGRFEPQITALREAMGILQHHDAVSGTAKQAVTFDYAKLLYHGIRECQKVIDWSWNSMITSRNEGTFCNYLNISSCPFTESGQSFLVTIYNPLAYEYKHTVRLPVNDGYYYQVFYDNTEIWIPAVLVPIPKTVRNIPGRDNNEDSSYELVFKVDLEALGWKTIRVQSSLTQTRKSARQLKGIKMGNGTTKLRGRSLELIFNAQGRMIQIDLWNSTTRPSSMEFSMDFRYYKPAVGANTKDSRSSGAYIFALSNQSTFDLGQPDESILFLDDLTGLVQEVHQTFTHTKTNIGQIIKVSPDQDHVEFEFVIGPINLDHKEGKEIVVQYGTNLNNPKQLFYTDSNGRQMLQRRWKMNTNETVAANYYPVPTRIALKDPKQNLQLTILNDRSQGGTIKGDLNKNATIELMVHRRLLRDDGFGVDEALNEPGVDGRGLVIRAKHFLLLSPIEQAARQHRPLGQQIFMQPIYIFNHFQHDKHLLGRKQLRLYGAQRRFAFSGLLKRSLPPNVHLVTLEQWSNQTYLLRLEHFYQKNEDEQMSQVVRLSLRDLFRTFQIIDAEEMTLAANQNVDRLKKRLKFESESSTTTVHQNHGFFNRQTLEIELGPMQIRTFIVKTKHLM